MDHKEQHHEQHRHERAHRKHRHGHEKKSSFPIHPLWLVIAGVVLTLGAVLVWIFAIP